VHAVASSEDAPEEIGMCLEDTGSSWTTYLRVPEIPDLANVRLRDLRSGAVEVDGVAHGAMYEYILILRRPESWLTTVCISPGPVPHFKIAHSGSRVAGGLRSEEAFWDPRHGIEGWGQSLA
jgi:hypothetical protein